MGPGSKVQHHWRQNSDIQTFTLQFHCSVWMHNNYCARLFTAGCWIL